MTFKTKLIKFIKHPEILLYPNRRMLMNAVYYDVLICKSLSKQPFQSIIDVGANVGWYTSAYRDIFPDARIYAFEPIQEFVKIINKKFRPHIILYNFALGDKNNKSKIYKDLIVPGNSSIVPNFSPSVTVDESIEIRRFDSLKLPILNPCLLKIDTEGYELEVLKGFGNRLKEIDVIQVEVNFNKGTNPYEIISYLQKNGFDGFIQDNIRRNQSDQLTQCDLFFYMIKK